MAMVLLSSDLMGASRVESAARLAGVAYRMVGTVDAAIEACDAISAALVAVDLATPGVEVRSLVGRLKQRQDCVPTMIAYGPHVHEAALAAAKAAGCDEVLSRGQFMARIDDVVKQYAAATD